MLVISLTNYGDYRNDETNSNGTDDCDMFVRMVTMIMILIIRMIMAIMIMMIIIMLTNDIMTMILMIL